MAASYRKAYVERRKAENTRDWLQGAYFYSAISTALGNAFRKKGQNQLEYLDAPFQIFPLTKEEAEAKAKAEQRKADAAMKQMIARHRAQKAAQEKKNAETTNT